MSEKKREPITITVYFDRKCARCGKKCATGSGYCVTCLARQIVKKLEETTGSLNHGGDCDCESCDDRRGEVSYAVRNPEP